MDQHSNGLQRLGAYSWVAVVLSVLACYGSIVLTALLALAGVTLTLHEGAQAALIVVLVWVAVLGMGVNIYRYKNFGPFILADLGALLVSWVMVVEYSRAMEGIGFLMLMAAAFWDRSLRRRGPATLPES